VPFTESRLHFTAQFQPFVAGEINKCGRYPQTSSYFARQCQATFCRVAFVELINAENLLELRIPVANYELVCRSDFSRIEVYEYLGAN
jgi:hypothetical protein